MAYITVAEVRLLTNITDDDISDFQIESIIPYCTAQLNRDIVTRVIRENVDSIDNWRENKIDGSNKVYFIQNWKGKYIADYDNDGDIDSSDVIVTQIDSNGDESTLSVASVSSSDCKITMTTAPASGVSLYVTYNYANVPATHGLVKLACAYLVAAIGFAKMNIGTPSNFSVGEIRVTNHVDAFKSYYNLYAQVIRQINDEMPEMIQHEAVM